MKEEKMIMIPFGKAARVGNYKLWRSKGRLSVMPDDDERKKVREESGGKRKAVGHTYDMEYVNVSNLDGSWSVRIPQASMMYSTICNGYNTTDDNIRDQFLGMIFTNMQNICLSPSEALHDALFFLTEMMSFPYLLLSEKEMVSRMEKGLKEAGMEKSAAKEHIKKMVDYRRQLYELIERKKSSFIEEYDRQQAERRAGESDAQKALEQEEIAEQAMDILNEKSEA